MSPGCSSNGKISEREEARAHPRRNALLQKRALGGNNQFGESAGRGGGL